MQKKPSYWENMSTEMNECQDNHQLARILGFPSHRFAFMNVTVQCGLSHGRVHAAGDRSHEALLCAD